MLNKQSWVYAGKLKRHKIELAHNPSMGMVYVRLNGIPLYEESMPNQQQTKTISFFIDDELCVLTIEKVGDRYAYRFTSPEYSSSSTAKIRKWKDRLLIVAIIGVFTSVFGGFGVPFVYNIVHTRQLNNNLDMGGIITTAKLVSGGLKKDDKNISLTYQYLSGLRQITQSSVFSASDSGYLAIANLTSNTENLDFEVLYSASNPNIHRILLPPTTNKE